VGTVYHTFGKVEKEKCRDSLYSVNPRYWRGWVIE